LVRKIEHLMRADDRKTEYDGKTVAFEAHEMDRCSLDTRFVITARLLGRKSQSSWQQGQVRNIKFRSSVGDAEPFPAYIYPSPKKNDEPLQRSPFILTHRVIQYEREAP
jgi:hypothetical protein